MLYFGESQESNDDEIEEMCGFRRVIDVPNKRIIRSTASFDMII